MRTLVTPAEMQGADRRAVEAGTSVEALMDRAGRAVARAAIEMLGGRYGKKVVVVSGKGNNGGDGYAAARILKREGVSVTCLAVHDPSDLKGAARHHHELARRSGVRIDPFDPQMLLGDLVVDAILGTGFTAHREEPDPAIDAAGAIQRLRERDGGSTTSQVPPLILAVDIPSGISGERGAIGGTHVIADRTVTFAAEKVGTFLSPPEYVGQLEIADIGIAVEGAVGVMDGSDVTRALPTRRVDSHKRSSGNMVILAGSDAMTGAAALVARGAFRAGCGYVTVASTARVAEVVHQLCPEALVKVLTANDHLDAAALDEMHDVLERATVIAAGPGLGSDDDQQGLIERLVKEWESALVLDADALNVLEGRLDVLKESKARIAVTPHPAELARLLGTTVNEVEADRLGAARRAMEIGGCDVLLKGYRTVISGPFGGAIGWITDPELEPDDGLTTREHPPGDTYLNPTGGPELATAGTGDVLTGVAATFVGASQSHGGTEALAAAAYVHGLAGEIAAREKSDSGVVAWDVAEALPAAIASLR